MEAKVLPVATISMAEMDDSADRTGPATVATGGPASVTVEDEEEALAWEGKGVDGTTSPGPDAVWVSRRAERERLTSIRRT